MVHAWDLLGVSVYKCDSFPKVSMAYSGVQSFKRYSKNICLNSVTTSAFASAFVRKKNLYGFLESRSLSDVVELITYVIKVSGRLQMIFQ